jgi:UDP-glucose/galactose:(glucosyl)LPS alpha-1,2-glucosyl/galactosyltransferase
MNMMHVCYTCDANFLDYLAVSIESMLSTMAPSRLPSLTIHVVQIGFSAEQQDWLRSVVARHGGQVQLRFYPYTLSGKFNRSKYKAIEIVTLVYYLPEFLQDVERVIFVDGDTFFMQDISELWQLDLEGHWIATNPCVLDDASLIEYGPTSRGHFWSAEQTINAGVMVMDLQKMREQGVTRQLERWTERHQASLNLPEQEAIAFNYPIRKLIDHRWNWRGALKYGELYWCARDQTQVRAYSRIEPAMVHLQHPFRPLNTVINSRYFGLWTQYFHAIGRTLPQRRVLDFENFLFLMTEDKSVFQGRGTLGYVLRNLPHVLHCLVAYRSYRRSPETFVFPTIEPWTGASASVGVASAGLPAGAA